MLDDCNQMHASKNHKIEYRQLFINVIHQNDENPKKKNKLVANLKV